MNPNSKEFYGNLLGNQLPSDKRFKINSKLIEEYKNKTPPFEFNGLGEIVYLRTYSREKEDGTNEVWIDTVERVVTGIFEILQHYMINIINCPWNEELIEELSSDMFKRIFEMKFLPPGRGLWAMGSPIIRKKGFAAALNNCAFVSTQNLNKDKTLPFTFLMDASMLGVGVGFDTKGANSFIIKNPNKDRKNIYTISDDREGWVNSVKELLNSYFEGTEEIEFDYSQIRKIGTKLKTFGGTSSGPGPLITLHNNIKKVLSESIQKQISVTNITDIMNMIGVCTVSGNIRRCLPENSLVHTINGLIKIKYIKVNNLVLTANGSYSRVTNIYYQGYQTLLKIYTKYGYLNCTENHKVAVINKDFKTYNWIAAKYLTEQHILITTRIPIIGKRTELPVGLNIVTPTLDENMAWFIGLFYNNGFYQINQVDKNFKYDIVINLVNYEKEYIRKILKQLLRFNENLIINKIVNKKGISLQISSYHLTDYFINNIKNYGIVNNIPNFIMNSQLSIRLAFIAGLIDSVEENDCKKIKLAELIENPLALQIQALCYSCGFEVYIKNKKIYTVKFNVTVANEYSLSIIHKIPQLHKIIKKSNYKKYRKNIDIDYVLQNNIENEDIFCLNKVEKIEQLKNYYKTYDIEVENTHEFYCNGYLVHNSAEIAFGDAECSEFLSLKSYDINPQRQEYGWASNNSVFSKIGMNYEEICKKIINNGEPGFAWLNNMQDYSRMVDKPDYKDFRVSGGNPCLEQSLESMELCCLVETFPNKHETLEDFKRTLYLAFLYAKIVTLLKLHWKESNEIMMRNRRIGCSVSGIAQFITNKGLDELKNWLTEGYDFIQKTDIEISDWLCVRNSIKTTSVKPSGTISLLAGATPGIHYPESNYYIRRMRLAADSNLLNHILIAGYHVEPCVYNPDTTIIVSFPIAINENIRTLNDVSMWEQLSLAAFMQKYWSDNQVSATITFDPETEGKNLVHALEYFQYQLKGISFLPRSKTIMSTYKQMPYESITKEKYEEMVKKINKNVSLSTGKPQFKSYDDSHHDISYCDNDKCY